MPPNTLLLAQAGTPPVSPGGSIALGLLGVGIAVVVGVFTVVKIHAWYHESDGPADGDEGFLLALRDSQREGAVSDDEFRSIQSKLADRRRGEERADLGNGDRPIVDRLLEASEPPPSQ